MQLFGSIAVALAIVAVTIALVTAKLGPNAEDDGGGRHEATARHSKRTAESTRKAIARLTRSSGLIRWLWSSRPRSISTQFDLAGELLRRSSRS